MFSGKDNHPWLAEWVQGWLAQELVLHCNVWSFPVLRLGKLPSIKSADEPCPCAVLGETPCFRAVGSPGHRDLPRLSGVGWSLIWAAGLGWGSPYTSGSF